MPDEIVDIELWHPVNDSSIIKTFYEVAEYAGNVRCRQVTESRSGKNMAYSFPTFQIQKSRKITYRNQILMRYENTYTDQYIVSYCNGILCVTFVYLWAAQWSLTSTEYTLCCTPALLDQLYASNPENPQNHIRLFHLRSSAESLGTN